MPLNKPFQHQPSAIASYSFTDIADRTGVVSFNLAQTSTSAGNKQILTTQVIYSGASASNETPMEISDSNTGTTFTERIDKDFDLTSFNSPVTIRGTSTLNLSFRQSAGSFDGQSYIIAKIRKVPLVGAEIEIASAQTITTLNAPSAVKNYWHAIPIIIPLTSFKKGEIFRLTIGVWSKVASSGTIICAFGTDPKARDGPNVNVANDLTTNSTFDLPFNIDL